MLAIAFGARTDNTNDPLVLRALSLGAEFMHLTGMNRGIPPIVLLSLHSRPMVQLDRLHSLPPKDSHPNA